jgi:hypothetical protein
MVKRKSHKKMKKKVIKKKRYTKKRITNKIGGTGVMLNANDNTAYDEDEDKNAMSVEKRLGQQKRPKLRVPAIAEGK